MLRDLKQKVLQIWSQKVYFPLVLLRGVAIIAPNFVAEIVQEATPKVLKIGVVFVAWPLRVSIFFIDFLFFSVAISYFSILCLFS